MKIQIDHIAKIEGHASFVADIINGDVKKARLEIDEGARLIESILIGRHYEEAPTITSRICGVCPVVHNLTSIRAIEMALNIKIDSQTILLRRLMMAGQLINSHCAHLFFFSLGDFFGIANDLELIKKYPEMTKNVLRLRDFGNKLIEVIGGRTIHPLTPTIGGFRKLPKIENLKALLKDCEKILNSTIEIVEFFVKLDYPKFNHSAIHASLSSTKDYAIYDGEIKINNKTQKKEEFIKHIREFQLADSAIKSTKIYVSNKNGGDEKTYMVGALARMNNNHKRLNQTAQKILKHSKIKLPCKNPFYNIFAQAIELIHCIEEAQKILKIILKNGLKEKFFLRYTQDKLSSNNKIDNEARAGKGFAITEAPRGILYHYYEIDERGLLKNVNIITPTAQNLSRLEDDFMEFLPEIKNLPPKEQKEKIKMLVRAYDPCLTCATH